MFDWVESCVAKDPVSGATAFASCVQAGTTAVLAVLTAVYVVIYLRILQEMRWPEPKLFAQDPRSTVKRLSETGVEVIVSFVVWNVGNGAAKMLQPTIQASLNEPMTIREFVVPSIVPSHVGTSREPVTFYARMVVIELNLRHQRTIAVAMPYSNARGRRRRTLRLQLQCAFQNVPPLAVGQRWDQIAVAPL